MDALETFVHRVYYLQNLQAASLYTERVAHFKTITSIDICKLIFSRAGLTEHIKTARIQGGWLWREDFHNGFLPDVTKWSWEKYPMVNMFLAGIKLTKPPFNKVETKRN